MIQFLNTLESDEPVVLTRQGPVATLVINRPDQGNAIDNDVRHGIIRGVEEVSRMADASVLVLAATGDAFSVGGDVAQLSNLTPNEAEATAETMRRVLAGLRGLRKPVIAAIKGPCLGVGLEIAMMADIRFCRIDARFGFPGINLGITPAGASILRLEQLVGAAVSRAMFLTGSVIDAERAFILGLATNVLAAEEFDSAVDQLAAHMAALSPVAVSEMKGLLNMAADAVSARLEAAAVAAFARCYAEGDANMRWNQMTGGRPEDAVLH